MAEVGSIVETRNVINDGQLGQMREHRFVWTSSADTGAVSGIDSDREINGYVVLVATIPGADAAAPDDQYDLTILDGDGLDILGGEGANRSNTNKEQIVPKVGGAYGPRYVKGKVQITVASAGNSNSGTVVLYVSGV